MNITQLDNLLNQSCSSTAKFTDARQPNRCDPAVGPIFIKIFNNMLKEYSFGIRFKFSLETEENDI